MAIIEKPEGPITLFATPEEALEAGQPVMEIEAADFYARSSSHDVKATMERVDDKRGRDQELDGGLPQA